MRNPKATAIALQMWLSVWRQMKLRERFLTKDTSKYLLCQREEVNTALISFAAS